MGLPAWVFFIQKRFLAMACFDDSTGSGYVLLLAVGVVAAGVWLENRTLDGALRQRHERRQGSGGGRSQPSGIEIVNLQTICLALLFGGSFWWFAQSCVEEPRSCTLTLVSCHLRTYWRPSPPTTNRPPERVIHGEQLLREAEQGGCGSRDGGLFLDSAVTNRVSPFTK